MIQSLPTTNMADANDPSIGMVFDAVLRGESFTLVDGKADNALTGQVKDMLARGRIYAEECGRRGVKFLPKQVTRPAYKKSGLADGVMLKSRSSDFFMISPQP